MALVSIVIPVYNEEECLENLFEQLQTLAGSVEEDFEFILVDDGSSDNSLAVIEKKARENPAFKLVVLSRNFGQQSATTAGLDHATGDAVVTMDADGEHRAQDIPRLVRPILSGEADLVLGARTHISRPSERFLTWLTRLRVREVTDTGTGFRALRRELALRLELHGRCICGISVLEPAALGARIVEVPIQLGTVAKPRRIAWYHVPQLWYILRWLLGCGEAKDGGAPEFHL